MLVMVGLTCMLGGGITASGLQQHPQFYYFTVIVCYYLNFMLFKAFFRLSANVINYYKTLLDVMQM